LIITNKPFDTDHRLGKKRHRWQVDDKKHDFDMVWVPSEDVNVSRRPRIPYASMGIASKSFDIKGSDQVYPLTSISSRK
jgi:hypothetical protein